MPLRARTLLAALGSSLALASCGGGADQARLPPPGRAEPSAAAVSDSPVKIGPPYTVRGVTYTPEDTLDYDDVGYASWYGEEQQGNDTANGEAFLPDGISAAHRTLPLPSYVEVTALDSGRTILVRVNDRGPFSPDRLIDLSRGAAEQLGIMGNGSTPVRVRRVNPPEQERAALRNGGRAAARLETPETLLAALRGRLARPPAPTASAPRRKPASGTSYTPPPVERPKSPSAVPVAAPGASGYVVQVAAFSSRQRAEDMAGRIGARAIEGRGLWRVRLGPYPTADAAKRGVDIAAAKGYAGAKIMANDTP